MSFNASSFFSPAEDTFLNTRNKNIRNNNMLSSLRWNDGGNEREAGNVSDAERSVNFGIVDQERKVYQPDTSLMHNLTSTEISPFVPIKSLIESPFKPVHAQSTPANKSQFHDSNGIGTQSQNRKNSPNAESILKMKLQAHRRQFQDSMSNLQSDFSTVSNQVNQDTYLHSAFRPRRSMANSNSMTHLKDIGTPSRASSSQLEPLRMSNFSGLNSLSSNITQQKQQTPNISESTSVAEDLNNPYMNEALSRIVNKELETRRLLYAVLAFFMYRFFRSIIRLFVYTHPFVAKFFNDFSNALQKSSKSMGNIAISAFIKWVSQLLTFENILKFGSYLEYFMSIILLVTIVSSLYKLLKPQDKCLDLPLSKAQRKILGLSLNNVGKNDNNDDNNNNDLNDIDESDEEDDEKALKKLLSASPKRMEKPVRVIIPDSKGLDDVMGSLNSLAINRNDVGNMTWSSGMISKGANEDSVGKIRERLSQRHNNGFINVSDNNKIGKRDFISPSGKYMFGVNNELRNQDTFGACNSSFY